MDSPTPQQGKTPTGPTASFNAAVMSPPPPAKTVTFASIDGTQRCPAQNGAVWHDECLLRYSNSTSPQEPGKLMYNSNYITIEPSRFRELMLGLMSAAATEAANDPKKFTTRKDIPQALNHCTLMYSACRTCRILLVWDVFNKLFQYELYPFYNENLTLSPPPPALTPSPPSPVTRPKGNSGISASIIIAIVAPITATAVLFVVGYCFLTRRARRKKYNSVPDEIAGNDILTAEAFQFDFGSIQVATNRFMTDNKLGAGGFGEVYKGVLPNGQEKAVKRLSRRSGQGAEEFKNEVVVVAKL
ncbi:hypothetical protein Dsin_027817 [Dipteronia sinensis]|uniref:Protein kinase domain-containing protein n=1 Tax=Dipteronia sinensis TaxID=43782 RepID=A0AAD9ZR31_9ROSI|nr:hypothetical protein Dsin_027817 [Dipteronia sinensis]